MEVGHPFAHMRAPQEEAKGKVPEKVVVERGQHKASFLCSVVDPQSMELPIPLYDCGYAWMRDPEFLMSVYEGKQLHLDMLRHFLQVFRGRVGTAFPIRDLQRCKKGTPAVRLVEALMVYPADKGCGAGVGWCWSLFAGVSSTTSVFRLAATHTG